MKRTILIFLLCLLPYAHAFVHYDYPYIAPQSSMFEVKVNGEPVHVYKTIIGPDYDGHNYVHFAMDGPVTVEVKKTIEPDVMLVGPDRFGIETNIIDSNTFSFVIDEPHQYVVTTNAQQLTGNGWGTTRHNLFIFADPFETYAPSLGDSDVINAKDYANLQKALDAAVPGKILYFPASTYEFSQNLNIKDNSEIYLAPGAYWKDTQYDSGWHIRLSNKQNIQIFGPGTIDTNGGLVVSSSSNIVLKDFVKLNTGVHDEPGRYYWGPCMAFSDSDDILVDNVKSVGLNQQVGTLPYPDRTAHDGIRLRSLQNSIVKNSLSIASDDPFHIVANSKEDSVNVTVQNSVAIGLAAQGYWGSAMNPEFPDLQVDDARFIGNDVFRGTLYATAGSTHNPDILWKDIHVDVSHHQTFFRIGGLPNYIFSDNIDAVVENLNVSRIHTDNSNFVGFYIKGNPNVANQHVHFKNLWIVDRYIYSFQDILDLGMDKAVMQDVDVTFEVSESPPQPPPTPVNQTIDCQGLKLLASFNEEGKYLDSSGNENEGGCATCPEFTAAGRFSGAYLFDGVNDFISFSDSESLDFDKRYGTISMWVKPEGFAARNLLAIDEDYQLEFNILNEKVFFYPYADSGWQNYNMVSKRLQSDVWQHIAVTWDYSAKSVKIFIDGTEQQLEINHVPAYWDSIAATGTWHIGGTTIKTGEYFDGVIDDVSIWDRPLSAEEIEYIRNNGVTSCSVCGSSDSNQDNEIDMLELVGYIEDWKNGNVQIDEIIRAVNSWLKGCQSS